MKPRTTDSTGFVTLIGVLLVGVVGVAIALSLLLLGVDNSRTSFAIEQSSQAKALANACTEEALQRIRDSFTFTGSGNLTLGQGTCSYTVSNQGAQNRTVIATGVVGAVTRRVKVVVLGVNPVLVLTSWQEVADF